MFNTLNILLVLAFLCTIVMTVISRQTMGPEGPIGAVILPVIPGLFLVILVIVLGAKGLLNFVPGGGLIQFVLTIGILITFGFAIFAIMVGHINVVQVLLIAVPYLILASFAGIIHHSVFPNPRLVFLVAAIFLGVSALAGWGLAGMGFYKYIQKEQERFELQAQEEMEQADEREQWEVTEYAKLDDSASLYALLQFVWARNDQVQEQACERVSRYPELDDKLIELLDKDCKEAISYIAKEYENPPAKFAPAWGRMLERQLKKWDNLQYDEHAGTWEYNLRPYFEGAQKIQDAGGSLHNELLLWHKHLLKCKGLGNLNAFVKTLLETKSKS